MTVGEMIPGCRIGTFEEDSCSTYATFEGRGILLRWDMMQSEDEDESEDDGDATVCAFSVCSLRGDGTEDSGELDSSLSVTVVFFLLVRSGVDTDGRRRDSLGDKYWLYAVQMGGL